MAWQDRKRGQLITSRSELSRETGLSEKVIRLGLERLKKTGEIIMETTKRCTLITVCNYDRYQGCSTKEGQQKTNIGPAIGQEKTIKEESNKKN